MFGREYPMLKSVLRESYLSHVEDGLKGIQVLAEAMKAFRSSAIVKALPMQVALLSPRKHNRQIMATAFPKEAFTECRFPAGTVLWFDDPALGHLCRAEHDDPNAMTNSVLFKSGTWES